MVHTTRAQREALLRKFQQNPDGSGTYREFRERVKSGYDYIYLWWCGMLIGIEEDGYTHS